MDAAPYYRLDSLSVLDLVGDDAGKILHNLTTNEVATLEIGQGCESFITDVRGKTLGHVVVFRTENSLRLIGPAGQSEKLAAHADRYTIREAAEPRTLDENFVPIVIPPESVSEAQIKPPSDSKRLGSAVTDCGGVNVDVYQTFWLGDGTLLVLVETEQAAALGEVLSIRGLQRRDEAEFHRQRTLKGIPWYGIDIDDSNLPQEADRNETAISFTKGCYLGQETVARLDALGQVQKKLVLWSIEGIQPEVGTALTVNEKTVGRLTSVAATADAGRFLAIGMARRSHFDAGATAEILDPESGETYLATVQ